MEFRMEHTAGLGKEAQVWIDGELLTVCDNISSAGKKYPPGVLADARLTYVSNEAFLWEDAIAGNRACKKLLTPSKGWSYVGLGQIVSLMPTLIDFGQVQMEDANWTTDNSLVGKFVRIVIDRLEISPAATFDWPKNAR